MKVVASGAFQYARQEFNTVIGKKYTVIEVYYLNDSDKKEVIGSFKPKSENISKEVGEFLAKKSDSKLFLSIGINELIDSEYPIEWSEIEKETPQKFAPIEILNLLFEAKKRFLKHHLNITDSKLNEATLRNALNMEVSSELKREILALPKAELVTV
jgi:hypothetical protein